MSENNKSVETLWRLMKLRIQLPGYFGEYAEFLNK